MFVTCLNDYNELLVKKSKQWFKTFGDGYYVGFPSKSEVFASESLENREEVVSLLIVECGL